MPIYKITGPDGKAYEIEGPAGASREEVIRAIQAKLIEQEQPKEPEQSLQSSENFNIPINSEKNSSMDVRMPDGVVISNVPIGTTKSELLKKYEAYSAQEQDKLKQNQTEESTIQLTEQISKPINIKDAYMDTAEVFVFVVLITGLVFYFIMPKKFKATTPFEMGRVWLGWLMGAAVLSASNFYVKDGIDKALGMFLATAITMGPIALLFGWSYGKYFKFASKNSNTPINSDSANKVTGNNENSSANNSYLLALEEYESDKRDKALWAKCFALCDGDEAKTKAAYVKERANKSLN